MVTAASVAGTLALGLAIGVRHATDADHVAAIATVVSERRTPGAAAWAGLWWGIGHGVTLLALGGVLLAFGLEPPVAVADVLEGAVGVMLIVLGALALVRVRRASPGIPAAPPPGAEPASRALARPLAVGVVHGLAGTGAVVVATVAAVPREWALGYLAVLAVGTVAGMVALTLVLALPLAAARGRAAAWLVAATGVVSLGLGGQLLLEAARRVTA
ncbi:MAG: high-affinity nickel-transport family protein [Polyangiaceae bacterium]|nr:high-affinity nickel-transport family protein [Polyangiaceae bacterium]